MARTPKRPKPAVATGFGEERQAAFEVAPGLGEATSPGSPRAERRLLKLGPDGRVLIPADWRQAMELKDNDTLVAHLENGELKLHGSRVGLRKAQAVLRRYVPEGVSLADELIEDRRREAASEAVEGGPAEGGR